MRIQITTDDKIYFYLIDPETLEPNLENVMFNYMNCTQMMFGSKVKYGITYKTNQRSFSIYRRKYLHNFKVPVVNENLEGSKGLELTTMNIFLVTKTDRIVMYNSITFEEMGEIPIKLLKTETREPNEVISMQKCQNEEYLAVISGKNLIASEQKTNQLFIFQRVRNDPDPQKQQFTQIKRIVLKDIPIFEKVCMKYHFLKGPTIERDTLLFAKIDQIFSLNFENEQIETIYKF